VAWVLPVGDARISTSSRSRSTAANGSGSSGARRRQPGADLPRLDLCEHGQRVYAVQIVGRPLERGGTVLPEAHRPNV